MTRCFVMPATSDWMSRGFATSTSVPAESVAQFMQTVMPKTWKSGMQVSTTSEAYSIFENHALVCCAFTVRLRCVSMAPFETPVVPPVYWSTAISSRSTSGRGGSG